MNDRNENDDDDILGMGMEELSESTKKLMSDESRAFILKMVSEISSDIGKKCEDFYGEDLAAFKAAGTILATLAEKYTIVCETTKVNAGIKYAEYLIAVVGDALNRLEQQPASFKEKPSDSGGYNA